MRCSVEVVEGSCVLRESKCGLRGCRVGEASNPGPRVKRRRRVESSSPQSGSDFSNLLDGLEEDLGVVARTETDPVTTPRVPPSAALASTVPASSPVLREVHPGGISVPIEVPTTLPDLSVGQSPSSNRFAALTEIDPMEDDHARVVAAPRPRLRLMSQVSDIVADPHVSGSDTESIDGASEGEMLVVDAPETVPAGPFVLGAVVGRRLNEGLASLDLVDPKEVFESRASVMRTVPLFLRGAFSAAMRLALQQIISGREAHDPVLVSRAWKLFMLMLRLLLFRQRRGRYVPKEQLQDRFRQFERGEWLQLLRVSQDVSARSASRSFRSRRREREDKARAARALSLVRMGELSRELPWHLALIALTGF